MFLLKCKDPKGIYRDYETGVFIAPGKVVEVPKLTAEMRKWLQAGGLVQVQEEKPKKEKEEVKPPEPPKGEAAPAAEAQTPEPVAPQVPAAPAGEQAKAAPPGAGKPPKGNAK